MDEVQVQSAGFLLELSPDWLIQRASENVHRFLGEYPARLVGEPLSEFTLAQPLHDLRNSLARLRSASGIARAYRVRLIDEPRYFDIAFQLLDGRILLEGVPSPESGFGEALGSVSRLIDGLDGNGRGLLESAARRMRAMSGFDRVSLALSNEEPVESSRSSLPPVTLSHRPAELPAILLDSRTSPVGIFPKAEDPEAYRQALLRAPSPRQLQELRDQGIRSMLNVPVLDGEEEIGCFSCDNRTPVAATIELHAAAELFAQVLAMRL